MTSFDAHVYIRDASYLRLDELTDWVSLSCVVRFNGVGTWALETSSDSNAARLLAKTGGIIVTRTIGGVEETIFSGSVSTEWTRTARTFRAAGRSDEERLEAPALPYNLGPPYTLEYDVRTGVASTIMNQYVAAGLHPTFGRPDRVIPGLTLATDPLLGGTVTGRGRFQPIISILQEIASTPIAGGLGFRMHQPIGQASLQFSVYQPVDRSAEAKFSTELGTLQEFEDRWQAPGANYFYVLGGDGLGAARSIIEGGDPGSVAEVGRQIEAVVDARGVADTGELQQKLAESLAGTLSSRQVTIQPFDAPSLEYGVHYDLGDLVTVVTPSGEMVDLIREVQIDLDAEKGVVVTPMIGQNGATNDDVTARYIASVQDRLSNIERNWTVPDSSIIRAMLTPVLQPPIGKVEWLAHATLPIGYLACNGAAVNRTTYSLLFAALGTLWGAGNGSTTFNLPDLRDRSPIGSGSSYSVGQLVGAASATVSNHSHTGAPHTHPGSHSHATPFHDHTTPPHSHTGAPHTHPGSHSHGLNSHTHGPGIHQHNVDINHDHPSIASGGVNYAADSFGRDAAGATGTGHFHNVNVAPLGTSVQITSNPGSGATDAATGNTATDSTVFAASFSGNTGTASPTTDAVNPTTLDDSTVFSASFSGNTGLAGSASISLIQPSAGLLAVIYAGQ